MSGKKKYDATIFVKVTADDLKALQDEAARRSESQKPMRVSLADMVREAIYRWREWLGGTKG